MVPTKNVSIKPALVQKDSKIKEMKDEKEVIDLPVFDTNEHNNSSENNAPNK